jgi:signal transduction histidine kinase
MASVSMPRLSGKDKRSLGLLGMRERASLLNGTFFCAARREAAPGFESKFL